MKGLTVTEYLQCMKFFQGLFIYIHKGTIYIGVTDSCRLKKKMEINIVLSMGFSLLLIDTGPE